ncbi:MAG: hypothetical protein GYA24_05680 [Candidatus Lokiarchaeota archaeon]|nr:hypothetical protein [Candidatus Lokiarchaeota archaeon]
MDRIELARRILLFSIGSILVLASILLISAGWRIPFAFIEYEIDMGGSPKPFEFDFSLFVYMAMMLAGIACVMVGLKLSRLPGNVIVSYPITRFLSGVLLVLLGIASLIVFGVEIGGFTLVGHWLFLGGFSMFVPTGMFPLLFGIPILITSAFTFMKLKVTRTETHLVLDEMRFPRAMSTEIPLDQVDAITLSNAKTGLRFLWVLVFIVPITFLYIDAGSFLMNPIAFGSSFLVGGAYAISATVQLACLLMLLLGSHHVIEIVTKDKVYELPFFPINHESLEKARLAFFLEPSVRPLPCLEKGPALVQAGDFKRLACGVLLIVLAIISRAFHMWAGETLRFILLIAGIIIVVDALKNDLKFVNKTIDMDILDGDGSVLLSSRGRIYRTEMFFSRNRQLAGCDKHALVTANTTVQPRKLSSMDHVLVTAIMFGIGLQGFPVLALVPASMSTFLGLRVGIVILVIAAIMLGIMLNPASVFKVKLGDRNYQVPVRMEPAQGLSIMASLLVNFWRKYKMVWQTHRLQVILRLVEMAIAAGIGMLASAIMFFG